MIGLLLAIASAQEAKEPSVTGKWLAEQDAQWQATYRNEVTGAYDKGVAELKKQYLASLESLLEAAAQAAKLDEAVAFRAERDRVAAGDIPADNDPAALGPVRALRAGYAKNLATLRSDRETRAKALYSRYDWMLNQGQTAMTQKQRLDEALEIRARREKLKAEWLDAIAVAAAAPAATTAGAAPATAAASTPAPGRSTPAPAPTAMATPKPLAIATTARPVERAEFSICGSNGITLYINNKEVIAGVRRDAVAKVRSNLKEGDVLVVKNQDRWDINNTWIMATSTKGEFLFETGPKWTSYAPASEAKWWIFKGAKEQKLATYATDKSEYVPLVKKSIRDSGLQREVHPIFGTVKFELGKATYLYYAVTREDLLPKADPK